MEEADLQEVGVIEGEATSTSIQIRVTIESIGRNDLVETRHEQNTYLLIVKETKRLKENYLATCEVIGRGPKTPFKQGEPVFPASDESIRKVYGLLTDEKQGLFLGWLRGLETKVWIPVQKLGRAFIVGKPGSGKSYTAGVITEELLKKGIPALIVDVHGEYSSLKVLVKGKTRKRDSAAVDYADRVLEFGDPALSPGADLEIGIIDSVNPEDLLVSGQCTILNLRGLKEDQQESVVKNTISKILEAAIAGKVKPFYCLLDEAHRFAGREKSETCDVLKKFTQEGRKFGANLIVITQRPQLLDVTVRSLSGTWLIHRLTDPNDTKIAAESSGLSHEWEHDINWLESGEAIVTGEIAEKLPFVVKVRPRETKHGAPGFNPLDYVSPEVLEKIKQRKALLQTRLAPVALAPAQRQPEFHVAETLKQSYLKDNYSETSILRRIKRNTPVAEMSLGTHYVDLSPCLFMDATVTVSRNNPQVSFSRQLKVLCDASASTNSIDFASSSAVGLQLTDLEKATERIDKAQTAGEKLTPVDALQSISAFEKLRKEFLAYAAQATSLNVLKHPKLDLVSEPDMTPEDFMPAIQKQLNNERTLEREKIQEQFSNNESKHEKTLAKYESDLRLTSKYLQEVEQQLEHLRSQKSKAQKERKATSQISDRIYRTGLKLTNLQSRQRDLSGKISDEKKTLEELKAKRSQEFTEADHRIDEVAKENLKTIRIRPSPEEVELASAELIWAPIHHAKLVLEGKTGKSEMEVWWNGNTGLGDLGHCGICGDIITDTSERAVCKIGLEPTCKKHTLICSRCGKSTCKKHSWTCKTCEKVYCGEEKHLKCAACKGDICPDCQRVCMVCGNKKQYCQEHITKCAECNESYCAKHEETHLGKCIQCGKSVCTTKHGKCAICGSASCDDHTVICNSCKRNVCPKHAWKCSQCNNSYCSDEKSSRCKECHEDFCGNCIKTCNICSGQVCRDDLSACEQCGRLVCPDCTVRQRRLLFMKRRVCKTCAQRA